MTESHLFIENITSFGYSLAELGFAKGASDSQLRELETILGKQLPDEFKQFLSLINGQYSDRFLFLPDLALLFSTDEIVSEYNELKDYFDDTIEFYNTFQFQNKIRCTVWSESRIPIAGRDDYYIFLDFDPGPNGTVGQVIYLINECDFILLAPDFKTFLKFYNNAIKNKVLNLISLSHDHESQFRLTTGKDFLDSHDFLRIFQ